MAKSDDSTTSNEALGTDPSASGAVERDPNDPVAGSSLDGSGSVESVDAKNRPGVGDGSNQHGSSQHGSSEHGSGQHGSDERGTGAADSATEPPRKATRQEPPLSFLQDRTLTADELRAALADGTEAERAALVSQLLCYAPWDELWSYVERPQVVELWDLLELPDSLRDAWGRLLKGSDDGPVN